MIGFSRHKVSDFDAYNAQALARIQVVHPDPTMTAYTSAFPDNNSIYCWALEDVIFTNLMTQSELTTVVSKQDAISQGMKEF